MALVLTASLALVSPVRADEQEASFHVEAAPVVLHVGDSAGSGATDTVPGARLSLRGTYGISDRYAAEVSVAGLVGGAGTFPTTFGMGGAGELRERQGAARLTIGLSARLGVRWIPTITAFAGFQHRWFFDKRDLRGGQLVPPPAVAAATGANDLVFGVGVGLDFRLGARWIFGVSLQVVRAVSLDQTHATSVELPASGAYYSYPAMW